MIIIILLTIARVALFLYFAYVVWSLMTIWAGDGRPPLLGAEHYVCVYIYIYTYYIILYSIILYYIILYYIMLYYVYTYVYMYTYIHIEREREREREIYSYLFIFIYLHTNSFIVSIRIVFICIVSIRIISIRIVSIRMRQYAVCISIRIVSICLYSFIGAEHELATLGLGGASDDPWSDYYI